MALKRLAQEIAKSVSGELDLLFRWADPQTG
jgi:hypothetical protein